MSGRPQPQEPLLILALPRSFSSITCAMLGQHPQLYGFPELHLFIAEGVLEWMTTARQSTFSMEHGLLRAVAQLGWGEQNDRTIRLARAWLGRRRHLTTALLFEELMAQVHPRIAVEKGPTLVYREEYMRRALRGFPRARFIHLVRHPRGYCRSIDRLIHEQRAEGKDSRWLLELACLGARPGRRSSTPDELLPQQSWYDLNRNVCQFLESVSPQQKLFMRGEDLLARPDLQLGRIAAWLGLRTDAEVIEAMKHPERSPYAFMGPAAAPNGLDPHFLRRPHLAPGDSPSPQGLDGLHDEVQTLARSFGYH